MLIAHLSDPHVTTGPFGGEAVAGLLAALGRALALDPRPDVLVVTGDLVEHGEPEEYEVLDVVLRRSPLPVHLVTGGHDRRDPLLRRFADSAHLPGGRLHYAVERDDARLIVLDCLVEEGQPGDDVPGAGRLGPQQLQWLDEILARRPSTPALLALHNPPIEIGVPFLDAMGLLDRRELGVVVARHPQVRGILAGHVHRPVVGTLGTALVSTAASTYRQSALEMATARPPGYLREPTTFLLHSVTAQGYVVHTVPVSHAGTVLAV